MKSNLILFLIFIGLLGVTFYTEEVFKPAEEERKNLSSRVFKQTNPTEIEFDNGTIQFQDNLWVSEKIAWPLNQKAVEEFLALISSIKVEGEILEKDKEQFFSKNKQKIELNFKQNKKDVFFLGNVNEASGKFYIKEENTGRVYICSDNSFYQLPYTSELDLNLKKYFRLNKFLSLGSQLFWDSDFFNALNISEPSKATFDFVRGGGFTLDFIERKTNPEVIGDLGYKDMLTITREAFRKVRIKNIIASGQNFLTDLRGTISIESETNYSFKYFLGLKEEYGHYIFIPGFNLIFEVEFLGQGPFDLTVQNFWNKKIQLNQNFKNVTLLPFQLSFDDKNYYDFEVYDLQNFKIRFTSEKVLSFSQVHMNVLFNLILNLTDFAEADLVQKIGKKTSAVMGSNNLYLKMGEVHLVLWIKDRFIHVRDLKANIEYLFADRSGQLTSDFFNSIFTVKTN